MEASDPQSGDFSRGDLDRVIRRAVELQFERDTPAESAGRLDEEEVRRIGAEVGIEDRFVRRAIGELRAEQLLAGEPEDQGVLARMVGDRCVRAHRVVPGTVDEVEPRLAEHLEIAETLTSVRARGGQSLWEPGQGALAGLRRGMRWRGYRYELSRITNLQVSLQPMEEGFVLVDLLADLKRPRSEAVLGTSMAGGTAAGGASVGVGLLIGFPLLAVPGAVAGALAGVRLARSPFRRRIERVRLTMEGILDRLEEGQPLARRSIPAPWTERFKENVRGNLRGEP